MKVTYQDDKKDKSDSHELLVFIDEPVSTDAGWGNIAIHIQTYSSDKVEAIKDMHFAIGDVVASLKQCIDKLEKANFSGI